MFVRSLEGRPGQAANPSGPPRRIITVATEIERARTGWGMIAGLLAAFIAVGVGQLLAGIVAPDASPIVAVGEASIDHTPPPVKNFAISAFRSNAKTGLVTRLPPVPPPLPPLPRAPALAPALLVRKARLAPAAADPAAELAPHDDPAAGPDAADPVPAAARWWPDAPAAGPQPTPRGRPAGAPRPPRRSFLVTGSAVAGTAAVAYLGGRYLGERTSVSRAQASLRIPPPADPPPPPPPPSHPPLPPPPSSTPPPRPSH